MRLRKGLDVPLAGEPAQRIEDGAAAGSVALLGSDTIGLRPSMAVQVGDRVDAGQPLYRDRQNDAVAFVSPGRGTVAAINRGPKRSLQSVVVHLDDDAPQRIGIPGKPDRVSLTDVLLASGDWTAFRTRPFGRIPEPGTVPAAIFVTAIDTNPHAPDPLVVAAARGDDFRRGVDALTLLTDGPVYVCSGPAFEVDASGRIEHAVFEGPHPAGLPGTHIHFLLPVGETRSVWHVGYQDVLAIGSLLGTGTPDRTRVVAVSGPMVRSPRLVRARLGASIPDLLRGELVPGRTRQLSGSALAGRRAVGPVAFLGRYHSQVTVLREGGRREFLAWMRPGRHRYSALRAYLSHLVHRGPFDLGTSQNGSPRAMVSIGSFERVMPLDILATPLLKSLLVGDTDAARALGCLELDEEDLALCSFVCNGKYEYGPFLRECLTAIEAHG